jgi:hypothetical protein
MHKFNGEVISTPDEESPFAAIIYADERIVRRAPVQTQEEGDSLIAELLEALKGFEKRTLH